MINNNIYSAINCNTLKNGPTDLLFFSLNSSLNQTFPAKMASKY